MSGVVRLLAVLLRIVCALGGLAILAACGAAARGAGAVFLFAFGGAFAGLWLVICAIEGEVP